MLVRPAPSVSCSQASYEELARQRIMSFSETADVVKLTDDEAEWLFGIPGDEALRDPSSVAKHFPSAEVSAWGWDGEDESISIPSLRCPESLQPLCQPLDWVLNLSAPRFEAEAV